MSRPDVTVAAIAERGGAFLIVEELIDGRRVFNQPAGHVETGETLGAAVVREALEETACRFTPAAFLGAYLWLPPRATGPTLRFAFIGAAGAPEGERRLDHPILATHWLTREQLIARTDRLRSPLVLRCIDDYLAGHHAPLALAASLDLASAAGFDARRVA